MYEYLKNKNILVTGASGSVGSNLVKEIIKYKPRSVRCLCHSEYPAFKLLQDLKDEESIRILLGDIQDYKRVEFAMIDIDIVFHCAAIKNLDITELNVEETVRTNVLGTLNLVKCALREKKLKNFLYINSDKAINPASLYGMTKGVGEAIVLWANRIIKDKTFSSIRFGNINDARGCVVPIWKIQKSEGKPLTITHPDMLRYYIDMEDAIRCIIKAAEKSKGGDVFFPSEKNMPEYKMIDIANKISTDHIITGIRKGEKIKEELYFEYEKERVEKVDDDINVIRISD